MITEQIDKLLTDICTEQIEYMAANVARELLDRAENELTVSISVKLTRTPKEIKAAGGLSFSRKIAGEKSEARVEIDKSQLKLTGIDSQPAGDSTTENTELTEKEN